MKTTRRQNFIAAALIGALALQHQLARIQEIRLRFFKSLSLRNGGGNLLHEAGISTLCGWFKNCRQFHAPKLSRHGSRANLDRGAENARVEGM